MSSRKRKASRSKASDLAKVETSDSEVIAETSLGDEDVEPKDQRSLPARIFAKVIHYLLVAGTFVLGGALVGLPLIAGCLFVADAIIPLLSLHLANMYGITHESGFADVASTILAPMLFVGPLLAMLVRVIARWWFGTVRKYATSLREGLESGITKRFR